MTPEAEVKRRCGEIADRVVPEFRVTARRSCASRSGRRWSLAYEAARLALTGDDLRERAAELRKENPYHPFSSLGEHIG